METSIVFRNIDVFTKKVRFKMIHVMKELFDVDNLQG